MILRTIGFCLVLGSSSFAMAQPLPTEGPVKPKEVRKIYGDGMHNAFVALRQWKGDYWVSFRHATNHGSQDGDLIVLRSPDAKTWKEVAKLDVLPDDRDPQFLATDDRLIIYNPAMTGKDLTTYAQYTDDGERWSKPQAVYEPRFIVWKPIAHGGEFWCAAHKKEETAGGAGREVHLIQSGDGLTWSKISLIRAKKWESETTLHFQGDHVVAFLRQKYGNPPAQVLEADAPYREWKARPAPINHFSGHSCHTFQGVTYLLTRTMDYEKRVAGQAIYTYEADGSLKLYCVLPAGGDCAYAEAVEHGGDMLVSYYSGHETEKPHEQTNIYLAVVPLRKADGPK